MTKNTAAIYILLASATCLVGATESLAADTLHYWRFENDPGFLEDSVGTATLMAQNVDQVTLPSNGRGGNFPTNVPGIGSNQSAADTVASPGGFRTNDATTVDEAFTIELFANFDDLSPSGERQRAVMAAQAIIPCCNNNSNDFSWAFVVEESGGQAQPRELELWVSDGTETTLFPSGIILEENTDFFLSASFDVNADIRFYVEELATDTVWTANKSHSLTSVNPYPVMGVMAPLGWAYVDGIVDEVRFSRGVVAVEDLLVNLVPEPSTFALAALALLTVLCRVRRTTYSRA